MYFSFLSILPVVEQNQQPSNRVEDENMLSIARGKKNFYLVKENYIIEMKMLRMLSRVVRR